MMTNEHEQNPHSNSTNQGGKFADQNVKPEAPAINDPWGIASVVASVMGELEPTLPATKQQPTTEVFASEGDQQPNEEPAEWVDLREKNDEQLFEDVADDVVQQDQGDLNATQTEQNVEPATAKPLKEKRSWFPFGRANKKPTAITEQTNTPVEPTISGDIESIFQSPSQAIEQDENLEPEEAVRDATTPPHITSNSNSNRNSNSNSNRNSEQDDDEVIVVTQTSKLTMVATGIALVLGMAGVGVGTLSLSRTNATSFTSQVELRTDMVARMDKLEGEIMTNKQSDQSAGNAFNLSLQKLEADIASMGTQLNDLKAVTEKISADTELSTTWSRQTRAAADDLAKTVDSINTAVSSASTEIARLKSSLATVSAQRQQAARAQVKAKRKQTPVTSIEGFKLFSVDDWGGVMLITMTKDDVVNRLQIGDFLEGWRVDTADIANKRVVFVKGDIRTIVIANGG